MRQASNIIALIPFFRFLLIVTSVAIIAVLTYSFLPQRSIMLLPDLADRHYLFYDGQDKGTTQASWINEKKFRFRCIGQSDNDISWPYCGIRIMLGDAPNGLDLSGYTQMRIKFRYHGDNKRIRFVMHNFNSAYSDASNSETFKPLIVEVLSSDITEHFVIESSEWKTSTMWIADQKIPRRLSFSEFRNIIDFGIDLVSPIAPGEHLFEIDYVEMRGRLIAPEKFYLGVALCWLIFLLFFIILHMLRLQQRIRKDEFQIESLAQYSGALKEQSERYRELSHVDSLTGVLNRNGFTAQISNIIQNGRLPPNSALLVIDIDHFKKVNDSKGHDIGDKVLSQVAKCLQSSVRSTDYLVRWGGEEFVLLLANVDEQEACAIAEKIRAGVEQLQIVCGGEAINITISVGLGIATGNNEFEVLFRLTDQALYKAKNTGRNKVILAT